MKAFFAKKRLGVAAVVAAGALALSACGGGGTDAGSGATDTANQPSYTVAKDVALTGSPTYDKIKSSGKVRIGVKQDQPGLGFKDAATGEYTGFDIEIAKWIAASLGVPADKIEFKPIPSASRESAITNGDIDYYVGTYSITDKRKQLIDFAGPYFITGQGLLVKKDNSDDQDRKGPGRARTFAPRPVPRRSRTSSPTSRTPRPPSSTRTPSVLRRSRAARRTPSPPTRPS